MSTLPFVCCDHCECSADQRIGHDDTCCVCQNPDGSPLTTHPTHDQPEES